MQKPKCQKTKKSNVLCIFAATLTVMLALIAGCDPANKDHYVEQIVLQGQMFVGQAPEIRLAHTVRLETRYDPNNVGISGADVVLTAEADTFHLTERLSDLRGAGYYGLRPGDSLILTPGAHYSIRAIAGTDTITAQTRAAGFVRVTVPARDQAPDTILYDGQFRYGINWERDSLARGYWLIYENVNPHHADDSTLLCATNAGPDKREGVYASYWSVPPTMDSTNSPAILFNRDGLHRARIFSCDSALWYWSSTWMPIAIQPNPISNVHGALGLFSVGGVDTVYFYIAKNPAFDNCP
ncbi:MAG TPA: hypothetical protein VGL38_05310 [bacterium]|jgi:predicted nucleic acid-binding protein